MDKARSDSIDEQSMDSLDMNTINNLTPYNDIYPLYKDQNINFSDLEYLNRGNLKKDEPLKQSTDKEEQRLRDRR